jgi:predicted phosphodiesterase
MTAGRPKATDEELQHTVNVFRQLGENQTDAATAMGLSRTGLQGRLKQASLRGLLGTEPVLPGFQIASINTTTDKDENVVRTSVRQIPEVGPKLEFLPGFDLKQRSTLSDGDQNIKLQWHIEKPEAKSRQELMEAIKAEFEEYRGAAVPIRPPVETYSQIEQYYPICDPHIGMLSWGKQTGNPNDLKIGTTRVENGIQRLVALAPQADTAVIIQTGDFLHADNQRNVTEVSGHQLDVDGRSDKMKLVGVRLMRTTIDLALTKHRQVIVKNLKGNHDPESAAWLNISLGMFYENEPRVLIDLDDGNNDIWLHLFGKNYVGATHGHTMKPERMAMVMADDRPDYWGESEYRWMIFGHIHHETVKEVGSVRCESFRQPVPKDSYAHSHGYRAGNSMSSVTLHKDDGEIGRHKVNFPRRRLDS